MSDINFLSKITGLGQGEGSEDLAASIQAHLLLLLNTRKGQVHHLPDFGLPDIHYVYYSLPQSLERLGAEIKKSIEAFEPRLSKVEVTLLEAATDNFRASYRITAEVTEGSKTSSLTFETEVNRVGQSDTHLVNRYG